MCGIAGVVMGHGHAPSREVLQKLANALLHRGPDGHALYAEDDTGLVHTRLAIVDLHTGAQPFVAANRTALVANGEIYNDLDLRKALVDASFVSASDCESALHLYGRDGENFASGLRGMYAIAIHDPAHRKTILARDPFGIKPLYYAQTPDGFYFASEPQALIAAGVVAPHVNTVARDELLGLQFTASNTTAFTGLERVAPGETLIIEAGKIVRRSHQSSLPPPKPDALSEAEAHLRFESAWADSIAVHRRADVPYGMFLSGGIDSTAVLAMMARQEPRSVLAYTAAFPGTAAHDERDQARHVAKTFGASHVEVEITAADFWQHLPRIAATMDDPVADYAIVPSYLLAARAKADVKVILSGEGGDELFAGYGRYRAAQRPWPFRKAPWRKSALAETGVLREASNWRSGLARHEAALAHQNYSRLQAVQALDIKTWLPNDLLLKVDRCLMAHGIEGRVPFLDPVVAQAAFHLPDKLKIRNDLGKWLLRTWVSAALPSYPAFERKKGFSVPVGAWIADQGSRLAPLMAAHPAITEICHPARVSALFSHGGAKRGAAQWLLLFYALWHNRHILGRSADGDVFAVLDAAHS